MKTGIFIEPDHVYHANRDAIGSSELRQMALSPRHFYSAWKQEEVRETTEAMEHGKLLHSLLLEQDIAQFVARPVKPDGELIRSNSKDYAHFLAMNPGKTPIRPEMMASLEAALDAYCAHDTAMKMIKNARIEMAAYAQDESGLFVKARPDILGDGFLVDLKSTKKLDRNFERTIFNLNYPFQLAHYAQTVRDATGEEIKSFYVLGFETCAPFGIKIYRINSVYIDEAVAVRREWLNEISVCLKENSWPCYPSDIIDIVRPNYMAPMETESFEVGA